MKDAVEFAKDAHYKTHVNLMVFYQKKNSRAYSEGMSGLHSNLIAYYGATEGKRKWASVIRNIRMEEYALKKARTNAASVMRQAKATLKIALKHM
jgi:hypothetical protein